MGSNPADRLAWLAAALPWVWLVGSLLLVAGVARSAALRRLVWHARVPVAFAILACVALAGPEQTRFLLAGIDGFIGVVALLGTVLLTGIGAWFWARWSLNLAWQAALPGVAQVHDGFWWRWLPRIIAVSPAVAALLCLVSSWSMMQGWVGYVLAPGLAAEAVLLMWLATVRRRRIIDRRVRNLGGTGAGRFAWFLADEALARRIPGPPRGLAGWIGLAVASLPFHLWMLLPLGLGFLVLVGAVQVGAAWPSGFAQGIGAAPTALLGLAALLPLLALPIGLLAAAWGWPPLLFLALLVVGAAGATVNTIVRTTGQAPPHRPELKVAATEWLQHCARPEGDQVIRAIVVANGGGASRAALWTAAVMTALEQELPGMQPGRHLFAISGISGGALGAAAYVATLDQHGVRCGEEPSAPPRDRLQRLRDGLGRDFLAPPLAGLFFGDGVWRSLGPLSALAALADYWPVDRSVRLERAWEAAFTRPGEAGMAAPLAARSLNGDVPRLPLLFTGGTHQESGQLAITAPVRTG